MAILIILVILIWRMGRMWGRFSLLWERTRSTWLTWAAWLRRTFLPAGFFSWFLVTGATLTAFGFLIFVKPASELLEKDLFRFDSFIGGWIISFRSSTLTSFMQAITNLGSVGWVIMLIIAVTVIGFYLRKRLAVLTFDFAAFGAFGLSELLKGAFHRARPPLPWLTSASGYSFPSGHALISFTLYGFLAYLILQDTHMPRLRYVLAAFFLLLPILIGISRIYLGVHYPSDVLAGWAIASSWICICVVGVKILNSKSDTLIK